MDHINTCMYTKSRSQVDGARLFSALAINRTKGNRHKLELWICDSVKYRMERGGKEELPWIFMLFPHTSADGA